MDLLLLKILALEPFNGWATSQRLKQVSGDVLQVSDGSLHPASHKLEEQGWISAEWKPSENNRRAKFYSLTRLGRKHLGKRNGKLECLPPYQTWCDSTRCDMRLQHWLYTIPLRLRSLSYFVGRGMRSLLYQVGTMDVPAFSAVAAILLFSALLACYVPARRAAHVDPVQALRAE